MTGVVPADAIVQDIRRKVGGHRIRPMAGVRIKPPDQRLALLTPGEVAEIFRVDPKTVTRWHKDGDLGETRIAIRTPGNHRRYLRSWVEDVLIATVIDEDAVQILIEQGLARYALRTQIVSQAVPRVVVRGESA